MSRPTATVDPSNAGQAGAWDGTEGAYWTAQARRFDESLAHVYAPFLDAAGIGEGDRVVDVGCGTGQATRDAARIATAGSALGIDLSSQMLALARQTAAAEGVHNVEFEQDDAQIHPFEAGAADCVISRMGSMFFGDPVAAFSNLGRALRSGGRLTLLTWQALERNEWISEFRRSMAAGRDLPAPPPDAPSPFALSDPDRVRAILSAAGFGDIELRGLEGPMRFGSDPDDALQFVLGSVGWLLEGLDETGRADAIATLRTSIEGHADDDGVSFGSATWIITARAR